MAKTIGSFDLASLKVLRDDVTQYFWFESDSSFAWGSGAHVTLYPQSQFTDSTSPNYMKGQNIIMNTDGFSIRNGALPMMVLDNDSLDFNAIDTLLGTYTTMATFGLTGATIGQVSGAHIQISGSGLDVNTNSSTNIANFGISGARIGKNDGAHSMIDADGQRFYASNGTTQLANIGYAIGASISGTAIAPYYDLGVRRGNTTPGNYSLAEGYDTQASAYVSHAEGSYTSATARNTHAEGYYTQATNDYAHAEGYHTTASGKYSHAQNHYATARYDYQTAIGRYNDNISTNAFEIGNGTGINACSNAFAVDWNGKLFTKQIQAGTIAQTTVSANSYVDVSVTFPKTMSGTPVVTVSLISNSTAGGFGNVSAAVLRNSVSSTGFTCRIHNADTSSRMPAISWIAMNVGTP